VAGVPFRPGGGGVSPGTGPTAPRQFSPLVPYLSFGWLPAGYKLVEGGTSRGVVWLNAGDKLGSLEGALSLTVYAAGKCHLTTARPGTHKSAAPLSLPTPAPGTRELKCSTPEGPPITPITGRAPAINGHRAFWGSGWLIWQYARNGWAQLPLPITPRDPSAKRAAAEREAVKMAENVRYGTGTPPLLFPLQLTHLPSRWQVSSVTYVPTAGVLAVSTYSLGSGSPNLGADGGLVYQTGLPYFDVTPNGPRANPCYVDPHHSAVKTINGYRVVLTNQTFGNLNRHDLCSHARGLAVFMSEYSAHPTISLASLFSHLRLFGRNPAHWTPNPIR